MNRQKSGPPNYGSVDAIVLALHEGAGTFSREDVEILVEALNAARAKCSFLSDVG